MNNKTINAMYPGQGLIIATVVGLSNDPSDPKRKEDNDPTLPASDQGKLDDEENIGEQAGHEERRENIGPDNNEWQEDQRKEDPHRDDRLRDKPKVDPINRPRDNI